MNLRDEAAVLHVGIKKAVFGTFRNKPRVKVKLSATEYRTDCAESGNEASWNFERSFNVPVDLSDGTWSPTYPLLFAVQEEDTVFSSGSVNISGLNPGEQRSFNFPLRPDGTLYITLKLETPRPHEAGAGGDVPRHNEAPISGPPYLNKQSSTGYPLPPSNSPLLPVSEPPNHHYNPDLIRSFPPQRFSSSIPLLGLPEPPASQTFLDPPDNSYEMQPPIRHPSLELDGSMILQGLNAMAPPSVFHSTRAQPILPSSLMPPTVPPAHQSSMMQRSIPTLASRVGPLPAPPAAPPPSQAVLQPGGMPPLSGNTQFTPPTTPPGGLDRAATVSTVPGPATRNAGAPVPSHPARLVHASANTFAFGPSPLDSRNVIPIKPPEKEEPLVVTTVRETIKRQRFDMPYTHPLPEFPSFEYETHALASPHRRASSMEFPQHTPEKTVSLRRGVPPDESLQFPSYNEYPRAGFPANAEPPPREREYAATSRYQTFPGEQGYTPPKPTRPPVQIRSEREREMEQRLQDKERELVEHKSMVRKLKKHSIELERENKELENSLNMISTMLHENGSTGDWSTAGAPQRSHSPVRRAPSPPARSRSPPAQQYGAPLSPLSPYGASWPAPLEPGSPQRYKSRYDKQGYVNEYLRDQLL